MPDTPPRRPAGIRRLAPLLLLAAAPAWAGPPPGVTLSKGQILLLSGSPALGFFTITNSSDQAMLIDGWSTPACRTLQLEEAGATSGGITRLTVPGKNRLAFVRGGYHLTCWTPTAAVRPGATIPVTVSFRGGDTLTAPFEVKVGTHIPTR